MSENDENRDTRYIIGAEVHNQFACRGNGHNRLTSVNSHTETRTVYNMTARQRVLFKKVRQGVKEQGVKEQAREQVGPEINGHVTGSFVCCDIVPVVHDGHALIPFSSERHGQSYSCLELERVNNILPLCDDVSTW